MQTSLIAKGMFLSRYIIAGLTGACIQLFTDYLWVDIFHKHYLWGVIIGFIMAVVVTFLLQKFWTFRDHQLETAHVQFGYYISIATCALLGNVVLMYVFVEYMHVWYLAAQACTIALVTGMSFVANNVLTFREKNFFTAP